MRVRFPCHVVTFAALVVLVRFPGNAVAQEPDQQGPVEIDIVITTRLNTTKEHVAAFRESLRKGAENGCGGQCADSHAVSQSRRRR
jgi:hypothetical protein